ncbi:zinc-dependent peptidase [Thiomicrorhabdus sp. zzn3]|uniref:M90 family metallopeptidase n=1 Tax=Thiomicrorhabdus sp. zzn3 TaxID=3039775 RepID=UPI0024363FE1|nr:zinc-dependent peptidase [Thiomicrorhabdus sp. zzn3]MDG6777731.1 zinc-dependent peptidase [Thiomicrorhabdus sp. zzn3]
MKWLQNWLTRYQLHHHPVPHHIWRMLIHQAPLFHGLSAVEKAHLRELCTLFLQRKNFIGTQELAVTKEMTVAIAAQACLLTLKRSLDDYGGWSDIVVYPAAFKVNREVTDSIGLVSHEDSFLGGEAWSNGPVILSWETVKTDLTTPRSGHNLVIHEFAHKLDMLNGKANGMPPLPADMVRSEWTRAFSEGYESLQRQIEHRQRPAINAYAATAPAEFFAVCSEYFFTTPRHLQHAFPAIYKQLALFYRQDPLG